MSYNAPVQRILFMLNQVIGWERLPETETYSDFSTDIAAAVLDEAGKLAGTVWGPLNASGDRQGAKLTDPGVVAADGFAAAYRQFAQGGWPGLHGAAEFGGQALPMVLDMACAELWAGANMALSLCPMLSRGAVSALGTHGTEEQKKQVLPQLLSGAWTGTMNLTEPQAGSDVGALKTRAEPLGDGTYKITGTKIFITWGDHDMAENIVHLVLARLPGAPAGTKGISLFLVPKFLINPDGSIGARNDLRCIGLEKKLGIHASPTCVMSFGEHAGAIGTLIGAENRGMACMFTMMNDARLNVGVQGLGIAEAAYQKALAFAKERRQGRHSGQSAEIAVPIIEHADVQRMLMTMRVQTEVARALCYATALATDLSESARTQPERQKARARADLLTPIAKAWATEIGCDVASLGVQIHGGMGYVEETGAAQYLRDARIAPIYEGTNGIQAIDLVIRKLPLDDGRILQALMDEMDQTAVKLREAPSLQQAGTSLQGAVRALKDASGWMLERLKREPADALAGATPYLALAGTVVGGHFLGKAALTGQQPWPALALFYAINHLTRAQGLAVMAMGGAHVLRTDPALEA